MPRHLQAHEKHPGFKCDLCGVVCKSKKLREQHKRGVHFNDRHKEDRAKETPNRSMGWRTEPMAGPSTSRRDTPDIRAHAKREVNPEIKPEVEQGAKREDDQEVKPGVKQEVKVDVKPEARPGAVLEVKRGKHAKELLGRTLFRRNFPLVAESGVSGCCSVLLCRIFRCVFDERRRADVFGGASPPLILFWTKFFDGSLAPLFALRPECPFECAFTEDRTRITDAQVRVFHLPDAIFGAEWPPIGNSTVFNAFVSLESPVNSRAPLDIPAPDFFNVSISYRSNSDVFLPYDAFVPLDGSETSGEVWTEEQAGLLAVAVARKSKGVLIAASECLAVHSGRTEYLRELSEHIKVTRVGMCFGRRISDQDLKQLIDEHHFYLAFENSVCPEYVSSSENPHPHENCRYTTEKFFRLKDLIVPVVLSRGVVNLRQITNDTFIAASDFYSPKELAVFLQSLIADKTAYSKYFEWTKIYRRTFMSSAQDSGGSLSNAGCQLCRLAVEARAGRLKRRIPSIDRFWTRTECIVDYAVHMIDETRNYRRKEALMSELVRETGRQRFAFGIQEFDAP
ncbi:Alpha-(1,3)-fucosyltransferase C [Aphelenchoides fujianensis]|nr:Alpha-(1,3)-fucosyltransferase C [Aphelenchoides fujianensis]